MIFLPDPYPCLFFLPVPVPDPRPKNLPDPRVYPYPHNTRGAVTVWSLRLSSSLRPYNGNITVAMAIWRLKKSGIILLTRQIDKISGKLIRKYD